jgi:regulation of enolase protein 1 (concanavalin A-like superfamily)
MPVYQSPANGAADISTSSVTLKWYAGLWAHKYDIYLGTTPTLTTANIIAADVQLGPSLNSRSYISYTVPGPLATGTTYYWKVVSKTMANMTASGPVWSFVTSGTASGGTLPSGWSTADIGAVGAAGSADIDSASGRFTVSGSGADNRGTNDEFRFAFTSLGGDGSITARVAALTAENAWTKAGVMMRANLADTAAHATMFVSAAKGLAFQRRPSTGGVSTSTGGPAVTAPYWIRMTRSGNTFTAFASPDGVTWQSIGSEIITMGSTIQVGLAVTSHTDGTVSTGTFDQVTIDSGAPTMPLPSGWSHGDIGSTAPNGSASFDSGAGAFTVRGAGADIWGTADAFHFAYTTLTGDGSIVARVAAVEHVNAWTKAGVMMRAGTGAGAAHASMLVTPSTEKGTAFQRRPAVDGGSLSTAGPVVAPPYWVKLVREGSTFSAYTSADGTTWTLTGTEAITMDGTIDVGLAVSSHVNGTLASATFDHVTVASDAPPPPPPSLPAGWSTTDIGSTSPAGSASFDTATSTYTVEGAGADVWDTADAFRYSYTTLTGDGEIVARVASVENVNAWTKAGVMIRDGLGADAAHAFMLVTPSTTKGTAFQRRPTAGGTSLNTPGPLAAPPYWVKLVRLGAAISAYASADGATWTLVDSESITMAATMNVGLAVSSHSDGVAATATFTNVTVTTY